MKRFLFLIILTISLTLNAQSLEGLTSIELSKTILNPKFIFEFVLGEQFQNTRSGEGITLSEGLLQGKFKADDNLTSVIRERYQVYPNPFSKSCLLQIPSNTTGRIITIYDTEGKQVWVGQVMTVRSNMELPVEKLRNGVYIIQVFNSKSQLIYEQKQKLEKDDKR